MQVRLYSCCLVACCCCRVVVLRVVVVCIYVCLFVFLSFSFPFCQCLPSVPRLSHSRAAHSPKARLDRSTRGRTHYTDTDNNNTNIQQRQKTRRKNVYGGEM